MNDNWRSSGRKVENNTKADNNSSSSNSSRNSNSSRSNKNSRKPENVRSGSDSRHHKSQPDIHAKDEAGSGFARNHKFVSRPPRDNSRDSDHSFRGANSHSRVVETDRERIEMEVPYNGFVKAVRFGREGGLYCQFALSGTTAFTQLGLVSGTFYNNKKKRPFQKGDKVQVFCIAKESNVELCLSPEYMRPLLILDINGPLGERTAFDVKDRKKKRTFIKRNHLQEFLSLVSEHYEVAIWSCSTRKNIELSLFDGINLVFVWCQEESTSLYPRTSFISPAKVGGSTT